MVQQAGLDDVFGALSDPTRRAIVARLSEGETPLGELAAPFDMSLSAVSKHVRVLIAAGLVAQEKRGRTRYCRLEREPLAAAGTWIAGYTDFWRGQLDSLAAHVHGPAPAERPARHAHGPAPAERPAPHAHGPAPAERPAPHAHGPAPDERG